MTNTFDCTLWSDKRPGWFTIISSQILNADSFVFQIESIAELEKLKGLHLTTLFLENNPVCESYSKASDYLRFSPGAPRLSIDSCPFMDFYSAESRKLTINTGFFNDFCSAETRRLSIDSGPFIDFSRCCTVLCAG